MKMTEQRNHTQMPIKSIKSTDDWSWRDFNNSQGGQAK